MEQKFEGSPQAEIRLEGRKVVRGDVANDWGSLLQWQVKRDGQVIATAPARADVAYEHPDIAAGEYSVLLQMWKYVNYAKNPQGEFTVSKFVDISNAVTYRI